MDKQTTVTINGVAYDGRTGLRLSADQASSHRPSSPTSQLVHAKADRTHTLSRQHVKVPTEHAAVAHKAAKPPVRRSPLVTKFADIKPAHHPIHAYAPHHTKETPDLPPVRHPLENRVQAAAPKHAPRPAPKPAQEIKRQAIEKALKNAAPAKKPTKKRSFAGRHPRALSIASASLALVLLAGYLTYINLPSISVRVAAAQAGIAATYPAYQPSGYSLHGPVAFSDGQVSMKFNANLGPQSFTLNQVKSNWDSSALLDNYVEGASQGDYTTYSDNGLTIYVYGTDAAWINDGILHTIQGEAPLSSDQIRHIATSM